LGVHRDDTEAGKSDRGDVVWKRISTLAAVAALAGAGAGAGIYAAVAGGENTTTVVAQGAQASLATTVKSLSIHDIYQRAFKGVVQIMDTTTVSTSTPFGAQKQKEEVLGSGFAYDTAGHVVTNYHVVQGGSSIKVRFVDGSESPATVAGFDASTDLAVLKVDAPATELQPLTLGDSSKVQVGDGVVAIGSPFGLPETVTNGIVSALGRTISSDNSYSISGAIQTDAAINHGNSGGPLLDASGDVIGVNSQIESQGGGSEGIGFAIASDTVRSVVTQLLSTGKVEHAYLGISVTAPSSGSGAQIGIVKSGSPAADAGMKAGDVVTSVGGETILTPNDLIGAVNAAKPGDTVAVTYLRAGKKQTAHVTFGTRSGGTP
jgi:putative serine protease PepD